MLLWLGLLALTHFAMGQDSPVCIIGAGIAGLKASSDLEKAQIPYIIVEGSSRIGGRVYPVQFEDGYLQAGATYINGDNNPIYTIAKDNGLLNITATHEGDDYVPIHTQNEVIQGRDLREFTDFADGLEAKYEKFAENGRDEETLAAAFEKEYQKFLGKNNRSDRRSRFDSLARMYLTDEENEWAATMSNFALENYATFDDGSEDGTEFALNKIGFKGILDAIAANIPQSKIKFNTIVNNIDYSSGSSVRLSTSTGSITCRSLIVTCSLGYLKRHSNSLFTPSLPQRKTMAINALGFGNNQKVFFVYDRPWLEKVQYRTMGPSTSPIFGRGLTFDVTPWSRKTVQFWFSGPAVESIGGMSDEQLMGEITTHLKLTLKNITVPTPERVVRHMWYSDSLILGSYSWHTPASVALGDANKMLADPIMGTNGRPLVQFAGEATDSTIYQTTIGAFLSGQREAKRLTKK
ncbi:hypothetical protein PRIPAC_91785 [Pristionchus pacificus]|uniref:Amino_oxidase domain-containing protein n=1 Tax=Pristionchus pacificus TaxID=54126 RepID=A0A2A6BQW0_PRIPA|nr:hypothetical protein PRIPAC_91785 [Pristionchus pacificus]|eukprot:PDM68173.1 hypothetical protein PRIPAC_46217 [Pristionchus pacificus]